MKTKQVYNSLSFISLYGIMSTPEAKALGYDIETEDCGALMYATLYSIIDEETGCDGHTVCGFEATADRARVMLTKKRMLEVLSELGTFVDPVDNAILKLMVDTITAAPDNTFVWFNDLTFVQ